MPQLLVSVNKLICLVKKKLKLPMRKRREKENIHGFGRNCCAAASTIYYACYTFSNDFAKIKRQDPHHSNRMFFLNTVVYDNFVHFQHCELALARDGKEKKMFQTRDRKRCSPPLPTNKRATLKIAVYVNCVLTKPVCNLKF